MNLDMNEALCFARVNDAVRWSTCKAVKNCYFHHPEQTPTNKNKQSDVQVFKTGAVFLPDKDIQQGYLSVIRLQK